MLLDPETFALAQRADTVLEADHGGQFAGRTTLRDLPIRDRRANPDLCHGRRGGSRAAAAAQRPGRARGRPRPLLASAGTHPFGRYEDQVLTDRRAIAASSSRCSTRPAASWSSGCTSTSACPTRRRRSRVVRVLRLQIPELIALSASSPFWRGLPSGLRSTRHSVFDTFPRSGLPPAFQDWREFVTYLEARERAGVLEDYTRIWWYVRPHPRLGTVEVRAMDAVERVEDAVALAAYVQALVKRAAEGPPHRRRAHSRAHSCARTSGKQSATGSKRPSSAPTERPSRSAARSCVRSTSSVNRPTSSRARPRSSRRADRPCRHRSRATACRLRRDGGHPRGDAHDRG